MKRMRRISTDHPNFLLRENLPHPSYPRTHFPNLVKQQAIFQMRPDISSLTSKPLGKTKRGSPIAMTNPSIGF
jgi:hypothetical protein